MDHDDHDPGDEHRERAAARTLPTPPSELVLTAIAGILGTTMYVTGPHPRTWKMVPGQPFEIAISPDAMRTALAGALVVTARVHGIGDEALLAAVARAQLDMEPVTADRLREVLRVGQHVMVSHGMADIAQAQVANFVDTVLTTVAAQGRNPSEGN